MSKKANEAINQAIDLLIDNDTDISTLFKEDGLLKQLTKRYSGLKNQDKFLLILFPL